MADGQVSFSVKAVVRGYHAYKNTWATVHGEELPCERETGNRVDAFAVAVMKEGTVVGHVPRKSPPFALCTDVEADRLYVM